ncbi:MAG: solute carrier family 26 protein [Trueperaceae bacterium]|nr:solute carrier family 26 protein [Trueperaceae bacterium]
MLAKASPPKAKSQPWLPSLEWLKRYDRQNLGSDLMAGLIVAVMLVPQAMAYAMLAGLPPVIGLYASTLPLIVYALFGSSRQLAVGPVAIVSLLTLSGVSTLAEPGSASFIAYAALLALMVGLMQFVLGMIKAGFITNFLSHAVISGFTSAAALIIGISQLKHLLGIRLESGENVFSVLLATARQLGETNPITLIIGIISIAILVFFKRIKSRFPAPLLVVILSSLAVYLFKLNEQGVGIVGTVPSGFPAFNLPSFSFAGIEALLPIALTISFVSFMESFAVARSIASKEKYKVEANKELVGLGLANVAGSLFSAYPVTGGFSRSAVNYQAGAKTPLASIVTAILVTLTLLFFTPLFYYLPKAVLAAIIMVAVYGLIDVEEPRHLFSIKPIDGWTLILTFAATLILGIDTGILVGAAFSLLVFIWRSAYPHTAELGYLEGEKVFRNLRRYPEAKRYSNALIARIDASLYFANMAFLETRLTNALADRENLKYIILDFSAVNDMDAVALETLENRMDELAKLGIETHLVNVKGPVRDLLLRARWFEKYGDKIRHLSLEHALKTCNLGGL